jgi:hypothetical protein
MYKVGFEASSLPHIVGTPIPHTTTTPALTSPDRTAFLVRIRLSKDICHCLIDAVDSVRLLVRDLNAKFLLNCHDDFHRIQAIQTEVVPEMRVWSDLWLSVHDVRSPEGWKSIPLTHL